jgi:hypothetical protein
MDRQISKGYCNQRQRGGINTVAYPEKGQRRKRRIWEEWLSAGKCCKKTVFYLEFKAL